MRIRNTLMRGGPLCGLVALGACLLLARPAAAELTLVETDGWTFFTDGRVNTFFSQGIGDDFPKPSDPQVTLIGDSQDFTAGYRNTQGNAQGKSVFERMRSGFLGSIIAFGMRRNVTEYTVVRSYVSLWATAEAFDRNRGLDVEYGKAKSFDVREGWLTLEGPWGAFTAGRQGGILGGISTEIDFLYGHNYGLGLPCLDKYYPTCGHIGTGALGPGNAAGFVYTSPSLAGLRVRAGLYDPVRLLGIWERVPYPRPEGTILFEPLTGPRLKLKLAVEGMYQYMGIRAETRSDGVWGVAGGGRIEAGPVRFGAAAFRGKGLGAYVALQNAASTFNSETKNFRYFTGLYAQGAVVFGKAQVSAGIGRVTDDLLPEDRLDTTTSNLKSQGGISAAFYYRVTDNVVLGIDYFRFRTDWWGAAVVTMDANGNPVNAGMEPGEKQIIHFINVGATFQW